MPFPSSRIASPDRKGKDFFQIVVVIALLFFLHSNLYIYLSSEEVFRKCFGLFNALSTIPLLNGQLTKTLNQGNQEIFPSFSINK